MWMSRLGWVVHKRAFVTLGHNSLPSACSAVGHKGIVQSAPVGGRALPETYGYIRTSRPESPDCRAATRKPSASSCWPPAWRFLTSIRTSASPEPPVPTSGGAGTLWTPGWLRATPWLWYPLTASGGAGWTPWATSTACNGPLYLRRLRTHQQLAAHPPVQLADVAPQARCPEWRAPWPRSRERRPSHRCAAHRRRRCASPPANVEATSVIIFLPVLARPAALPRSKCRSTSWERPRGRAKVAGRSRPALATRRWSSKAIWMRSRRSRGSSY